MRISDLRLSSRGVVGAVALAAAVGFAARAEAGLAFDLNFSGATGGVIPNVVGIDEMQFLSTNLIGYKDNDGNGIDPGDTFRVYTILRITRMTNPGGDDITPGPYGASTGDTNEITIAAVYNGTQGVGGDFTIDSLDLLKIIYDFGTTGHAFTRSSFTNLNTFLDTPLAGPVETATLEAGSGGHNSGNQPDGNIDLNLALYDLLHTYRQAAYFELDTHTKLGLTTDGFKTLLGLTDANNNITPPATRLGALNGGTLGQAAGGGFANVFSSFGLGGTQLSNGRYAMNSVHDTANGTYKFAFQARSDGSIRKDLSAVPEPTSILVWTLVASCFAARSLRRRNCESLESVNIFTV